MDEALVDAMCALFAAQIECVDRVGAVCDAWLALREQHPDLVQQVLDLAARPE